MFMAAEVGKLFYGYFPGHLVKNYRCFEDHLCLHHQGLMCTSHSTSDPADEDRDDL
jgi:hypothetical protein